MQKKHGYGIILIIALALSMVGCVQPASEELAPTQVGANATWTYTPPPTATDTPQPDATSTPASEESPTPTPSPTDAESAFIAQSDDPTEVAQNDTNPIDPNANQTGGGAAQVSDSQLTATAIIAGATQTQAFSLTATASSLGIGVATATPPATAPVELAVTTDPSLSISNITPGADCIHEVKAVDRSLYRLSLAYGISVNSIAQASGIVNPDLIRVGQMLTIPGCGTTGAVPPATSTPNPNQIATGGVATGTGGFAAANPSGDCTWGTSVIFPNGCPTGTIGNGSTGVNTGTTTGTGGPGTTTSRVHRVNQGETLYEISLTYGVAMDAIAAANGITNYDQITFNDQLVIP